MRRMTYSPYSIDVPGRDTLPGRSHARITSDKVRLSLRISDFCFIVAALAALGGMGLGIFMGLAQDFTLAPAHAHLNLLGWVTMALYGLYHRGVGRISGLAGWLQVGCGALGAVLMAGGLGLYLAGGHDDESLVPVVIAGSLMALAGMLMFLGFVLHDLRQRRDAGTQTSG